MIRIALLGLLALTGPAVAQTSPQPALELADCRISAGHGLPSIAARCGSLPRPLNPAGRTTETIELKVAVVPALTLEPAADAFVPIAGGPGQSTIEFYASWFQAFERVRQSRDIVLLDQRGTGDSAPMVCDIEDDVVENTFSEERTLKLTQQCLELLPHDPRFFTTSVAVRDLEALRIALGYSSFNVYGISYGTRVAQHYARRFPTSTRTLTLDGVVPPQLALGPDIATESQIAIDNLFTRCSEDEACNDRFPAIREDFAALRSTLAEGAVSVEYSDPVTGRPEYGEFTSQHLAGAVRLLLYNPRTVALLPLLINEAANGNFAPLAAQFHMVVNSLSEAMNIGMHNAVMCTEDAPFIDWAVLDDEAVNASYMGPLQLESIKAMCSIWPRGVLDDNLRQPLDSDIPALLLSGDADPITPAHYANAAARNLRRHWQITGRHQGHGLAAIGCMPRVLEQFVSTRRLRDDAADCMEEAFVMPFFVDFTGPTP